MRLIGLVVQRYGIFNPYTGRGAIKGLLPHGPHNVRDVLATHILKQTGSCEQASYAILDTPELVAEHYGRFLPQDKSALAAKILNRCAPRLRLPKQAFGLNAFVCPRGAFALFAQDQPSWPCLSHRLRLGSGKRLHKRLLARPRGVEPSSELRTGEHTRL